MPDENIWEDAPAAPEEEVLTERAAAGAVGEPLPRRRARSVSAEVFVEKGKRGSRTRRCPVPSPGPRVRCKFCGEVHR